MSLGELLSILARGLVDEPARVFVREESSGEGTLLELRVAPFDRGRVIGRRGRTVDALRVVLGAVARRKGAACAVEILE